MRFELITIFAIIFIGIPGITTSVMRKKVKMIMKRINPSYSGHVNNTFDVFRIIKAYKKSNEIINNERIYIRRYLILIGISWLTALVIIFLMVFYNDQILNI